jgi:hypothetical protein
MGKPDKSFFWLGKYLSLALTMPASLLAGYILGTLASRWLHWSLLVPLGIVLGLAAGLTHVLQELLRDQKKDDLQR